MSRPSLDDGGVSATPHKEQRAGSSSENTHASHPPIPIRIPPWCACALASCRMVKSRQGGAFALPTDPRAKSNSSEVTDWISDGQSSVSTRADQTLARLLLGYEGQADTFSRSRHSLDAPSLPRRPPPPFSSHICGTANPTLTRLLQGPHSKTP